MPKSVILVVIYKSGYYLPANIFHNPLSQAAPHAVIDEINRELRHKQKWDQYLPFIVDKKMQVAIYRNTTWVHAKAKGVYFYLQALSAKGWSPKGRRGTENTPPAGGIRICDLLVYRHMP